MPERPAEYLVRLRAEGPGPPAAIRLRAWLKAALRRHGLRCTRVEEVPPVSCPDAPATAPLTPPQEHRP